jgi:HK97 family phage portal protein
MALRSVRGQMLYATDGRDVLLNSPDGWEVEQPWLWWLGPAGSDGSGGPWGNPIPGAGIHGFGSIPGVARATSLIVDTLATLPWHVYRGQTDQLPTPQWILDPQMLRVDGRIVDPSAMAETRLSNIDVWGQWILSALWFGDGFIYCPSRDSTGAPQPPLWVLHPLAIKLEDGVYWVEDHKFNAGEIIHLRGNLPIRADGRGTGVLSRFAAELGMIQSLRGYMAGTFASGVPAGYLKTTAPQMTQDAADKLKARWMEQHGGGRRSIAVLNATTEFVPLTWSPVDVGAAEFARISLNSVALMFNLPAYLLGAPTDSNTYANVESRMTELYELTLLPWMKRIEAVLDAQLPRGVNTKIVIDGLLRADTKTRYESYQIALSNGFLTVNEVRALEGRPPLAAQGVA